MKTFLFSLIFIFILITAVNSRGQSRFTPGSDTILFDGESNFNFNKKTDFCKIKVTYLEGKATGITEHMEIDHAGCNVNNPIMVTGIADLHEGDLVFANGSEVKTGENSRLELTLPDQSVIRLGPNSTTIIDCNSTFVPDNSKISMKLVLGTIWSHVTHTLGGDNAMEIQTDRAIVGVRGTIFSFESKLENNSPVYTLRTYEGKVQFLSKPDEKINEEDIKKRSQQIQDDYKAGKISMEEMTKKIKELIQPTNDIVEKSMVMVEAGQESIIRGTDYPTQPSAFTQDPDEWFADKNFTH